MNAVEARQRAVSILESIDHYDSILKDYNESFANDPVYTIEWKARRLVADNHIHRDVTYWVNAINDESINLLDLISYMENEIKMTLNDIKRTSFWIQESTSPIANVLHSTKAEARVEFIRQLGYALDKLVRVDEF